jgi:hypothetical protein
MLYVFDTMQKDYVTFVEIPGDKTESQYRSYKQIGGGNVLIVYSPERDIIQFFIIQWLKLYLN